MDESSDGVGINMSTDARTSDQQLRTVDPRADWRPGQKLWWNTSGYGYDKRIPCELVRWAPKRAYVRYITLPNKIRYHSYVAAHSLEARHE